jgi:N-carbamoylputrescine amidase
LKNSILHLAIWDSKPFLHKGKIGTLICWDQWYPEAARLTALSGSEVLFYPTAIGWHQRKEQYGENQYGAWMNV